MTGCAHSRLAVLLAAGCLPALAGTENLDDALRRCARESTPARRLACFDALVSTLAQREADRFGITADIARKRDPMAVQHANDEVLSGRIAALRRAPEGEWIFTLDNRQVWAQAEATASFQFAVGEDVHIEHGAMSSLWLVADRHRKVRVKRLS